MAEKGLSLEQCIKRATSIIQKQNICLLLFEVKDSRNTKDLYEKIQSMTSGINTTFKKYLPKNDLGVPGIFIQGFRVFRGDSAYAGINSVEVISKIQEYQKEKFPEIELYWSIAEDGFDDGRFNSL
ncbi:MAG: hypothetical protein KKF50_02125 [Nanoarchaeota archaeon]|nr:hypothetical protein [Nanoarchaeota archaeon]